MSSSYLPFVSSSPMTTDSSARGVSHLYEVVSDLHILALTMYC